MHRDLLLPGLPVKVLDSDLGAYYRGEVITFTDTHVTLKYRDVRPQYEADNSELVFTIGTSIKIFTFNIIFSDLIHT